MKNITATITYTTVCCLIMAVNGGKLTKIYYDKAYLNGYWEPAEAIAKVRLTAESHNTRMCPTNIYHTVTTYSMPVDEFVCNADHVEYLEK